MGGGRLHRPDRQGLPQGGQPCPPIEEDYGSQDGEHQGLNPTTCQGRTTVPPPQRRKGAEGPPKGVSHATPPPPPLCCEVDTFLSYRQIGLTFDGGRGTLKPANTGTPRGSPISPILFLIYLRFLFTTIQDQHPDTRIPSHNSVTCLVVGDTEENCRKLEAIARTASKWGDSDAVAFDDPKTELPHFYRRRQTPECPVTLPNGTVIKPSPVVRWRVFSLTESLALKPMSTRRWYLLVEHSRRSAD